MAMHAREQPLESIKVIETEFRRRESHGWIWDARTTGSLDSEYQHLPRRNYDSELIHFQSLTVTTKYVTNYKNRQHSTRNEMI